METKETIEILNDLIKINNDRIVGYEKAINELPSGNEDLRVLFMTMIDQSRKIRIDLGSEVQALGAMMEQGTTDSGKLYRMWMDVKAVFTGHDRKTILQNCHHGEDAAQKAYSEALDTQGLPAYIRELLEGQKQILKGSHDEIKAFASQVEA